MSKKHYVLLGVIVVAIAILIGASYAFFMANVTGGDSGNETVIKSGSLNLTLADTNTITLNNSKPGDSASKEFTVTNTSKSTMIYNIKLVDVTNTFVNKNDLVYSLVGDNGINITDEIVPSVSDEYLAINISIDAGVTHTYTLTITFKETNDNQNDNMEVSFSGKINIDDENIKFTLVDKINELYASNNPELVVDDYENIRYIGGNPSNYIYFNCDDYNNPTPETCEKWRIIGLFKDIEDSEGQTTERVKIMRDEFVSTSMAWNSNDTNNWATASLNAYLNGDYYNSLKNDTTKNMIGSVVWNLGGSITDTTTTASLFYECERGGVVAGTNPTTWLGKIGLIYPSDYGYATSGGSTTNRETCLKTALYNWSSLSYCFSNNYIYDANNYQYSLTHSASYPRYVFGVDARGWVSNVTVSSTYSIKPVLYLKFNTKITSGDGSEANPYVLEI